MKMFILGLDGASYHLVKEFVRKNKMHNFKEIINGGHFRKLNSTIPPHTAPGWVTAFTGTGPGKHGVFQFWDTQARNYAGKFMGRDDFDVLPVWDILNRAGFATGMINIPMTHPPKKVNGFIITWPLSNTLRYAYPDDILFKIAQYGGHYVSDLGIMYDGNIDYIDKAINITRKRVKTLKCIMENYRWDFLVSVFTEIDRVSHFYWHYMDKSSPEYMETNNSKLKNAIEDIYCETDRALGYILNMLDGNTLLMILSDHGFGAGEINFYAQSFLMERSFLKIRKAQDCSNTCASSGSMPEVPGGSWFECVYNNERYTVDWDNTIAYMAAPGSYGININLKGRQSQGIVENEEYENIRDALIREFSSVIHPYRGSKLFKKIARREEVYTGGSLQKAPDLILIPEDYGTMVHHSIKPGEIFGSPEHKGMHNGDGILLIYGREAESVKVSETAGLEDIAPTILDYYGIDMPQYMDGKVLAEFKRAGRKSADVYLKPESQPNEGEKIAYTGSEIKEAEEKLKSLGYL